MKYLYGSAFRAPNAFDSVFAALSDPTRRAIVRRLADRVYVMRYGEVVEEGVTETLFSAPKHPYTKMLITSLPSLTAKHELVGIPGSPPSLLSPPAGCPFHPRCQFAMDVCAVEVPPTITFEDGVSTACHLHTSGPKLNGASVNELALPEGAGVRAKV